MRLVRDITGQRFGVLKVLGRTYGRENGSVIWECRCDCGRRVWLAQRTLVHRAHRFCGCPSRDAYGERSATQIAAKLGMEARDVRREMESALAKMRRALGGHSA